MIILYEKEAVKDEMTCFLRLFITIKFGVDQRLRFGRDDVGTVQGGWGKGSTPSGSWDCWFVGYPGFRSLSLTAPGAIIVESLRDYFMVSLCDVYFKLHTPKSRLKRGLLCRRWRGLRKRGGILTHGLRHGLTLCRPVGLKMRARRPRYTVEAAVLHEEMHSRGGCSTRGRTWPS